MNSSAMTSPTTRTRRLEKASTSPSNRSLRSASPGRGCTLRAINMHQNPAHGSREVVDVRVRPHPFARLAFLIRADAGPYQDAAAADRVRRPDIEPPVADDERPRRVEREIAGSAVDKAAARLPAVACARVFSDSAFRVVWTIVIRVDARVAC